MKITRTHDGAVWLWLLAMLFARLAFGATNDSMQPDFSGPPATARGCYNAGTEKLRAGKFDDAEALLESSLARQDVRVQPLALYNLGHVRFAQGVEELKKSPDAVPQSRLAAADGGDAIARATDALAGDEIQRMVDAYLAGRGASREMRDATKAVQRAMERRGRTLLKWRRSLDDFRSAAELNPADTNAVHNASAVEQAIARLVDSLREMEQAFANLGQKKSELKGLLKQLKGKIPAPDMPPGAPGGDEDDEGDDGKLPSPESLIGKEESGQGGAGQELGLRLSPEQAGQLMNSLRPDGKQLPMGQGETGQPNKRNGRIW